MEQGPRWRGWIAWASILACLPLAALPLVDATRAAWLETADPGTPSPLPSGGYPSLRLAGALALQNGQVNQAGTLLTRAIARSPLDAESWRLLAAVTRRQGRPERQFALLRVAAMLTWRDAPTQRRLMLSDFGDDRIASGINHGDALLRLIPGDPLGQAAMYTAMTEDAGRMALARHLAASPPWRSGFFDGLLIENDDDAQGLVDLLHAMRTTAAPPTPDESGAAAAKLIQAGHAPLALAFWREASGRPAGYDFANADPDFQESLPALQAGERGQPFGWALNRGAGIQIAGGRDGNGRPALTFDGPPDGAPQVVGRAVLLSPGPHLLTFAGSADGQPTNRFRPRFTCATDGRALSFDTLRPAARDGYQLSRVALVVPPDCQAIQLGMGLTPGDDGQVHGFALRQVRWARPGA